MSESLVDRLSNDNAVNCACGKVYPFSAYVYAHWHVRLELMCECGRKYDVKGGKVRLIALPEPPATQPAAKPA